MASIGPLMQQNRIQSAPLAHLVLLRPLLPVQDGTEALIQLWGNMCRRPFLVSSGTCPVRPGGTRHGATVPGPSPELMIWVEPSVLTPFNPTFIENMEFNRMCLKRPGAKRSQKVPPKVPGSAAARLTLVPRYPS